jgi:hypothetical protein
MSRTHIPCRECGVTHINPKSSSLCVECGIATSKLRGVTEESEPAVLVYITQYSEEEVQDLLASIIPADNFTTQQSDEDLTDYLETLSIRT